MGTRHADRYSGCEAPPSSLPLVASPSVVARPPPPLVHRIQSSEEKGRKARAVIPLPLPLLRLRLLAKSVRSSAGRAGCLQTSARGNFQGKSVKL